MNSVPPIAATAPISLPFFFMRPEARPPNGTFEARCLPASSPAFAPSAAPTWVLKVLVAHSVSWPSAVYGRKNFPLVPFAGFGAATLPA